MVGFSPMKVLSPASQQIIFSISKTEIQEVTVGEKHQHRRNHAKGLKL